MKHDAHSHEAHAGHDQVTLDRSGGEGVSGRQHGHGHHDHGSHADMFRRLFWINLVLALPVVVYSPMIQDWFGYTAPHFPGYTLVAPVFGSIVYFYGGCRSSPAAGASFATVSPA